MPGNYMVLAALENCSGGNRSPSRPLGRGGLHFLYGQHLKKWAVTLYRPVAATHLQNKRGRLLRQN